MAVETLISALKNKDSGLMRYFAARNLGKVDLESEVKPRVVAELKAALLDETSYVREAAAYSLSQLGQINAEIVSILLRINDDDWSPWVLGRRENEAFESLEKINEVSPQIIEVLVEALWDSSKYVRRKAAYMLYNLQWKHDDIGEELRSRVLTALLAAIYHDDSFLCDLVWSTLEILTASE
jgi:HEAT repeat protein